jgi:hypothetical protein
MSTTALSTLRDRLNIMIGDSLSDTVTTALTTSTAVVCTNLTKYTGDANYFKNWYVLITSGVNDGQCRKVASSTAAGTLTVYGANFASDGATLATFELHKLDPTQKTRAINNAARELYPTYLFRRVTDETLITGNALPNAHFEDWTATTHPDFWTASVSTVGEENTIIRGGTSSAKLSVAAGSLYCSNAEYPQLLDLMGTTIDFKCWVYASAASECRLGIYTKQADGTEQNTQYSSYHSGGSEWELLEIESYALNDDLTDIKFSLYNATTGTCYFDNARVTGKDFYAYLLPKTFQTGHITQVWEQVTGYSDDICDDVKSGHNDFAEVFGWNTPTGDDGYKYLRLPYILSSERKLRLVGEAPLEDTLSSDTDTMTIEGERVNLLLAYAAYLVYEMQRGIASGQSKDFYNQEIAYWGGKTERLKRTLKMTRPNGQIRWS